MSSQTALLPEMLFSVLDIIGYTNDKNVFVFNFTQLCLERTLLAVLESLPKEKQTEVKQVLQGKSPEETKEILKNYLKPETVQHLLQEISTKAFEEYIQTLLHVLSDTQREKLDVYLNSLNNTSRK